MAIWGFGLWIWEFRKGGWPTGLEPATTRTTIWGSTIELRPPSFARNKTLKFQFSFANKGLDFSYALQ